jgi:peptidyl-prolyl cis-trans isomerase SurA
MSPKTRECNMKINSPKTQPVSSFSRIAVFLALLVGILASGGYAQQVLDRIVAVVGDQIILESELNTQTDLYVAQMRLAIKSQKERDELRKQILEQMVNDKLLLNAAQKDTLVEVTSKEVDEALQKQMDQVKSEFTEEEFKAQLQAEGLTEIELRKKYREQIGNQFMIDRLIASKLQKVSVSAKEVKDFYQTYQDSIPDEPEAAKLSHILLEIKTSPESMDSLRERAESLCARAKKGEDFVELAKRYSDDPSAEQGGDLGFFGKGDMIAKFEEAAFSLQPGEVSDVLQTEFGYHVIKLEDKKDDRVHARHILILVRPSKEDTLRAERLADSLFGELQQGADFVELAKQFSDDQESNKMGGELGWYPVAQMTPEFKQGVEKLQIGEVSPPLRGPAGIHIVRLLDKKAERKMNLDEDWDTIKDMVRRKKTNQLVSEWVQKLRQDIYVEIRL